MALCRCGASGNKPYCDGTHAAIKFSGSREIGKPITKEQTYVGKEITIHDVRIICCHAADCVERLSSVFRLEERPWIDLAEADVKEVIDIVNHCPSGALSYSIKGVRQSHQKRTPLIRISKNGPYHIEGGIKLAVPEDPQPPSTECYALCRCGASKNKPYCDGVHHTIRFKDDEK